VDQRLILTSPTVLEDKNWEGQVLTNSGVGGNEAVFSVGFEVVHGHLNAVLGFLTGHGELGEGGRGLRLQNSAVHCATSLLQNVHF
jgi:hypothetical protein